MRARTLAAALALSACSSGYFVDQAEVCRRAPDDLECPRPAGSAGNPSMGAGGAGPGGASGTVGAGGTAGLGGGGAGGKGPCDSDSVCAADEGAGSLCVGGACTEAAATCPKATLVVVAEGFTGDIDAALSGACFYRQLDPALVAAAANGSATTRVVVYASVVEGPVQVPAGVRLEGRATAPASLVALTAGGTSGAGGAGGNAGSAGAGGAGGGTAAVALVTLGDGAVLTGFALDAEGRVGVRVAVGKASLEGQLELRGGAPALSVEGTASVTVVGTSAVPVVFTENKRGVVVGATAALEMTGEGGTGLVIEKTSAGVGVLVETGTGSDVPTKLVDVTFRENKLGSGADGIGAVEVRRNRQVLVQGCTFVQNQQSVTLNAQSTPSANLFLNVKLSGNDFTNALPAPGQGAAVCGSEFAIAGTKIQLEPLVNTFPVTGAVCGNITPAFGCTDGVDVGYDVSNTAPVLVCPGGT
jgi:hypothetical protein